MDQCLNQLQQSGEIVTTQWEKQSVQLTGTDLQHLVLINSSTNNGESWLNDKVTCTLLQILIIYVLQETPTCICSYAHTQLLNSYILLLALDQRAKTAFYFSYVYMSSVHSLQRFPINLRLR